MRRFLSIGSAVTLALALAAPVAAGANVSNSSGSATVAEASWFEEIPDGYSYGYLSAWKDTSVPYVSLDYRTESGTWVDCTPEDPDDDAYGFQGTYTFGYGEGQLSVGKNFGSASAAGIMDIFAFVVDECAGTSDETAEIGVAVSLELTAIGPKTMYRGTGSFHVPSEYNSHSSYASTSREAAGTATIGSNDPITTGGAIGKMSWRDHSNG